MSLVAAGLGRPGGLLVTGGLGRDITTSADNDTAAHAMVITSLNFTDSRDVSAYPYSGLRGGPGSWYSFTPTLTQTVTIDTIGSGGAAPYFDTYLYLLAADGTSILAEDDDTGGGLRSSLSYAVTAGVTYIINATFYSGFAGVPLVLNVSGPWSGTPTIVDVMSTIAALGQVSNAALTEAPNLRGTPDTVRRYF